MAIAATAVWEVRTTGSDNNGGGYNPARSVNGVDRSQQDAEHVFIDGSTITATVHTTTTQITISGYSVGNADLGNHLNITGGTATAGVYEITAVDTGNNRWTLDRSAGTSTQTVVGRMGGAFATPGRALGVHVGQNLINVNSGTYTITTALTALAAGDAASRFTTLRGVGVTRPILRVSGSSITILPLNNASVAVTGIEFDGDNQTSSRGIGPTSTGDTIIRDCVFRKFTNSAASTNTSRCHVVGCLFTQNTTSTVLINGSVYDCVFKGNTASCVQITIQSTVVNCLFIDNTGATTDCLIGDGTGSIISNNTFANNGRHAFNKTGASRQITIRNNIIYGNGGFGVTGYGPWSYPNGSGFWEFYRYNAFGANTSGNINGMTLGVDADDTNVILTANPFVNSASGDYRLNDTAGGGALCRAAASGSTLPDGSMTYLDIGALQHQDSGGGGGSRFPVIWGGGF